MKSLILILKLLALAGVAAPALAQEGPDKVGTVSMAQLLKEYYKTTLLVEEFKGYEETIVEEDKKRVEAIKALATETRELQGEAENSSLTQERQEELLNQVRSQQGELQALQNDRLTWLKRKRTAFAEKQKIEFGKLREEIMKMVQEVGEAREFDYIFDKSAAGLSGVGVMTYSKDATDLTTVMVERINRDAPEKPKEEEAE